MPTSLQKKFSRGVHYNMKILIKGDRNVGKSCLLQRLQGGPFIEEYVPTEQIQAAAIHWTYKDTDHIVKVDVWEVVDKARTKRKTPLGLKLENAGATGTEENMPALDATFLDVYKEASGVILVMDITKPWTFDYVVKELSNVPADLPLVLLGNHCDMQHHRQVHAHHVEQALQHARQTRTAPVRYAESSMRNGFGLRFLHKFLGAPFLRLQRAALLQQLQRNQADALGLDQELTDYQFSPEADYVSFVERLASQRRAGAAERGARGDRSPSIVLGAGKPILPQANLVSSQSAAGVTAAVSPPPAPDARQTQYVSPALLAPRPADRAAADTPLVSGGAGAESGGGGDLDEFYAGALDSSFLDDATAAHAVQPDSDSDSYPGDAANPMVARAQDDLDESDAQPGARAAPPAPRTAAAALPGLVAGVSREETGPGDGSGLLDEFSLWDTARRSPEGGEDPDLRETQSLKEDKKQKKSKKSKDKDEDKSERKEKKHKHKKCKSERKQQALLLAPDQDGRSQDQYDSL